MQNTKLPTRVLSIRLPYEVYLKYVEMAAEAKQSISDYFALQLSKTNTNNVPDRNQELTHYKRQLEEAFSRIKVLQEENHKLNLNNEQYRSHLSSLTSRIEYYERVYVRK